MKKTNAKNEWVTILGHPFHRDELVKLLIIGFLFILVVGGTVGYFIWKVFDDQKRFREIVAEEEVAAEEREFTFLPNQLAEAVVESPVEHFLFSHFAATRFNEVKSIRAIGTYTSGEVELEFTLMGKHPRFYKQVLKGYGKVLEAGYDGNELWYRQSDQLLDTNDESLTKLNSALAMLECSIPCLAWEYNTEGDKEVNELNFELLPEVEWNGRPCIIVKNFSMLENPVYHYIDKDTGLELYRRSLVRISERREKDVEIFFKEPMEDLEYPITSGFELWIDGKLHATASFDKVEVNRGIANYLFEEPKANP